MVGKPGGSEIWEQISPRRAALLGHVSHGRTLREAADAMGISLAGARSQAERIKDVAECANLRDLGESWRDMRLDYVRYVALVAGIDPSSLADVPA